MIITITWDGVDRIDELVGFYFSFGKSIKWYKKVHLHFLEEAMLNAHIVYWTVEHQHHKLWLLDFRIAVAWSSWMSVSYKFKMQKQWTNLLSLYPGECPTGANAEPYKRCVVCQKQGVRRESRFQCMTCANKSGLCPAPCFRHYHTRQNLWSRLLGCLSFLCLVSSVT